MRVATCLAVLVAVAFADDSITSFPEAPAEIVQRVREVYPRIKVEDAPKFAAALMAKVAEDALNPDPTCVPEPFNFTCEIYGPSVPAPNSVHLLRPADIKVVAAIGDSITAGFGAKANILLNIFAVLTEYRGVSWAIGGDEDASSVTTLPNLLRKYNPNVVGFSVKSGKADSANARLNVAVSGAIAQDTTDEAKELIAKIKAMSGVDFYNDWKVVTLFIGGNNLCDHCEDDFLHNADTYEADVRATLTILKNELPRTFVNLVSNIDVTRLEPVGGLICGLLHSFECPCGTSKNATIRAEATELSQQYNQRLENIANDPFFADKMDFTVVYQPFLVNTVPPLNSKGKPDTSYFSPDCFHFSEKAHFAAAEALWNSIFEPVGQKRTDWHLDEELECPPIGGFLKTNVNSKPDFNPANC